MSKGHTKERVLMGVGVNAEINEGEYGWGTFYTSIKMEH
jgi:hypothetical protein